MKAKKLFAIMLAMVLMVSALAIPASAANSAVEEMYASMGGGATVSSQSAKKNVTRDSMYYNAKSASSDGWNTSGNEWVYFRGRSASGKVQVTELAHRNYYGNLREGYMTYLNNYGSVNSYYKIAIQYDSSNPYQYVRLTVGWAP